MKVDQFIYKWLYSRHKCSLFLEKRREKSIEIRRDVYLPEKHREYCSSSIA